MSQTAHERLELDRLREERQLQRIERADPHHYKFPRHSSREHRNLRFAEQKSRAELRDAIIGGAVFAAFVGLLMTAPWWLA